MPHLALRDDENNTRKKRLAQLGRGPGTFIYDGSLIDVEHIPTPLLSGAQDVLLDDQGLPVTDAAGRAIYKPAGKPVIDIHGKVVMGGEPRVVRHKRTVVKLRGLEFKAGDPVYVANSALALKLRGMPGFDEVTEAGDEEEGEPLSRPAISRAAELSGKSKPGRKRKKKAGDEADGDVAEE